MQQTQKAENIFGTKNIDGKVYYLECQAKTYCKNLSGVWGWHRKSIQKITIWHHKACQVMTIGDPEGQIFQSHPQTNDRLFFLLTFEFHIFV